MRGFAPAAGRRLASIRYAAGTVRTDAAVATWILIFVGLFVAAIYIVSYREHACQSHCLESGYTSYSYKGFTGARLLRGDICQCLNPVTR